MVHRLIGNHGINLDIRGRRRGYGTTHFRLLFLLFLILASTWAKHFVQHLVPSEAVVIRAPAQPVQGIPQLGH